MPEEPGCEGELPSCRFRLDLTRLRQWRSLVIYHWAMAHGVCLMLYLYAKNEQSDLTARQTQQLTRLVREEFR
jgi:hypothetical protein